jgi:hypothetical protein
MKLRPLALIALFALYPAGAHATIITYTAILNGASESPVNSSPGTGAATVIINDILNTMQVSVIFQGLVAPNSAAHIHCCVTPPGTAGVATTTPTFTDFPGGVTAGTYNHLFDLTLATSYNPAFVTAQGGLPQAEAALLAGMAAGQTYLNIHSTTFPNGEIRGFLQVAPAAVPEPATLWLLGLGFVAGGLRTWRARRRAASH